MLDVMVFSMPNLGKNINRIQAVLEFLRVFLFAKTGEYGMILPYAEK